MENIDNALFPNLYFEKRLQSEWFYAVWMQKKKISRFFGEIELVSHQQITVSPK